MYIIKNALRTISRSKGRNILIGIIIFVIATSSCVALSIREAADNTKEEALDNLKITAQISVDRSAMMNNAAGSGGTIDKSTLMNSMQNSSLSLEEMLTYSEAEVVSDFYYTLTTTLNAGDGVEPLDTTGVSSNSNSDSTTSASQSAGGPQMGGDRGKGFMGNQGDFTVVGYSSDTAMTAFINGTSTITEGSMFTEGTDANDVVISDELATYNSLIVGDSFTLVNPNNEEEAVTLNIVGIYNNSQSSVTSSGNMGGFSTSQDPANEIYMSYKALNAIVEASEASAETTTDETTGITTSTAIAKQVSGTYVLDSIEDYEAFQTEAKELGLSDSYTITSSDVNSYEQSIAPLENLSTMALYFLLVVLAVGGIILVVLNLFNIRERKYEIGVLTAIGMKKYKVATQFVTELLVVTFMAIIIGTAAGAAVSVPVTNTLLASQIESASEQSTALQGSFGRDFQNGGTSQGSAPSKGNAPGFGNISSAVDYISQVSYSTDLTVVMELMLIGLLLTLLSALVAVAYIMRYEPLKILTNRE